MNNQPVLPLSAFDNLVIHETTVDSTKKLRIDAADDLTPWHKLTPSERDRCSQVVPISPTEEEFRHGGWTQDRARVFAALCASGVAPARIERFQNCGAACRVEATPDGQRFRLMASYCHDRFCSPCATARAHRVRRNLLKWAAGQQCLFITLTIRTTTETLTAALDHLYESFARLRVSKLWRKWIKGGAYFTEITRGMAGDHWHPHLHILAPGTYLSAKDLSKAWMRASQGSFKVDVQRAGDLETVGRYVTAYATKGIDHEVITHHDHLLEAIISLRGRRLCQPFGSWGRLSMEDDEPDGTIWRRIGGLASLVKRAYAGESAARGVLRALGFVVLADGPRIRFARLPREVNPPVESDVGFLDGS